MAQALCFLLPVLTVISHLVPPVAATSSTKNVLAAPRPADCPDKCGDVDIPYPYGIGKRCSRQGFKFVTCNHSFTPPRPYLGTGNIEVINISVLSGETRVLVDVSSLCYNSTKNFTYSNERIHLTNLLISATRNEFTAIGCNTLAQLKGPSYYSGCITSCVSLAAAARNGENCTGLGCCQTSLPQNLTYLGVSWGNTTSNGNPVWGFSPCSYAFIAEKGGYHFEQQDLVRNGSFVRKLGDRTLTDEVPVVIDWAIRTDGAYCPPPVEKDREPTAPACASLNSHCVNATQGPGYLCNCSKGYTGNPYLTGGCTNINECKPPESNTCPSGSKCIDTEGSYICKCKFGRRGKDCHPIFPAPAAAVLGYLQGSVLATFLGTVTA